MWDRLFEILPSLFLIVVSMIFMLKATHLKYTFKTTLIVVVPFLLLLITANLFLFAPLGIENYDNWAVLTVLLPEMIVAFFLGKRKGLSSVAAILNSYVAYYIIVLLKNVTHIFYDSIVLEYIIYMIFIPLIYLYIDKFYNNLHDKVEKLIPTFLYILVAYAVFIYFEFYMYRFIIQGVQAHILRLEIFGVAIISVYIVSIFLFDLILRQYHASFEKAKDKEKIDLQMKQVLNQFKIRDEKDRQLRIIRHDMRHILVITSTLLNEGKKKKALEFLNQQIELIDSTRIVEYCKDTILNAIICYYSDLCEKNNINLSIKMNNVEEALTIDTSEVAIVLSNCFENAFNASNKLEENREIDFRFINKNGHLVMKMKNNYVGKVETDKKNNPTTKEKDHGFGTKSIKSFVNKYNLILDYEIDESTFAISIIFN